MWPLELKLYIKQFQFPSGQRLDQSNLRYQYCQLEPKKFTPMVNINVEKQIKMKISLFCSSQFWWNKYTSQNIQVLTKVFWIISVWFLMFFFSPPNQISWTSLNNWVCHLKLWGTIDGTSQSQNTDRGRVIYSSGKWIVHTQQHTHVHSNL